MSLTEDRARPRTCGAPPFASLHVSRPDLWAYVVVDADVELSGVAAAPDDAAVEELVALYRSLQGEHEDWEEYQSAMVAHRRLVARLRPTHADGMWPSG